MRKKKLKAFVGFLAECFKAWYLDDEGEKKIVTIPMTLWHIGSDLNRIAEFLERNENKIHGALDAIMRK